LTEVRSFWKVYPNGLQKFKREQTPGEIWEVLWKIGELDAQVAFQPALDLTVDNMEYLFNFMFYGMEDFLDCSYIKKFKREKTAVRRRAHIDY